MKDKWTLEHSDVDETILGSRMLVVYFFDRLEVGPYGNIQTLKVGDLRGLRRTELGTLFRLCENLNSHKVCDRNCNYTKFVTFSKFADALVSIFIFSIEVNVGLPKETRN